MGKYKDIVNRVSRKLAMAEVRRVHRSIHLVRWSKCSQSGWLIEDDGDWHPCPMIRFCEGWA